MAWRRQTFPQPDWWLAPDRRAGMRRAPPPSAYGDVANLAISWRRTLAAESKSPATLDT